MCFPKNPEHFKLLMTLCKGEDWLLYSSDWPHATFDPLNWVFNGVISEEGREKSCRKTPAAGSSGWRNSRRPRRLLVAFAYWPCSPCYSMTPM